MNTATIVGIVILVVAVAILAATAGRILVQRRELRERYGDEYDRVVTEKGGRAAAEAELKRRERRHAALELQDLSPAVRDRYRESWTELQSEFIDDPKAAVHDADQLISRLVAERGYPVVDFDDRVSHLSVEHAGVLNLYRDAHEISVRNDAGTATTEDLRRALVNYRDLAADLLGDPSLKDGIASTSPVPDVPVPDVAVPDVMAEDVQPDVSDVSELPQASDVDTDREPVRTPDAPAVTED